MCVVLLIFLQELNSYQIPVKSQLKTWQGRNSNMATNTKNNQKMKNIQELKTLPLCSQCLRHEVNSWVNENWKGLDVNTKLRIREELKGIRLKEGECIVCGSGKIAKGTGSNILEILEDKEIKDNLKNQFMKYFCLIP